MKKADQTMQDTILQSTILAMGGVLKNAYAMLSGLFMSILGYFLPVKDIVHLLILFFVLDVFFGFWAAKKLRKERFSVKIIWSHTIPRMLVSIVLILGAYMWDSTYQQDFVNTYMKVGKNDHDDGPDTLTGTVEWRGKAVSRAKDLSGVF